jgi:signal transduction histidine kinase
MDLQMENQMMVKSLSQRRHQIVFGVAVLALLVVGLISHHAVAVSRESDGWVRHTHEVLENLQDLLPAMERIESTSRRFALTGDESELEPYHASVSTIEQRVAAIRNLTVDNPVQQGRIPDLERLIANKIEVGDLVIRLRRTQGTDAAEDALQNRQAPKIPYEFSLLVQGFQQEEMRLLAIRDADARLHLIGTQRLVVLGTIVGLLIAVAAAWSTQRDGFRRTLAERLLESEEATSALLEQRVAAGTSDLTRSNLLLQEEIAVREKAETELRQAQKLDALGRLAAGVAHDFNNLLAIVLGQSELLLEKSKDAESIRRLEIITASVSRGAALTRQLLAFGRRQVLQTQVLDFNAILAEIETLLRVGIGENIDLELRTEAELGSIDADPGQLEQVILNLALNARDAMPSGGKLTITTANVQLDEAFVDARVVIKPGRYVQIVVTDTGCGMNEDTQSRIFEPFFTTKEVDKGTGLGLATVYGIVKQSGGYIWVYSELGHGTSFKVYLPMVETTAELLRTVDQSKTMPSRGTETILLVEDDSSLREVTCEVLESSGYSVISAESPERALFLASCHHGPIDFLLTDIIMPNMNGRELATKIRDIRPNMKILYSSGYSDGVRQDGVHGALAEGIEFLQKPFTRRALTCKVREILDSQ